MFWPNTFGYCFIIVILSAGTELKEILPANDQCDHVCDDLPEVDLEPVCMMFSRYKKGFQFFVNHCHARKAVCKENLLLHIVHPNRCKLSNQFFLPIV